MRGCNLPGGSLPPAAVSAWLIVIAMPACCEFFPARSAGGVYPSIPAPRGYVAYRADTQVKIDGRLEDDAWQGADWSQSFTHVDGANLSEPALQTRVKMLWDDEALYIGAYMVDPQPYANATGHEGPHWETDKVFTLLIDVDGDNQLYIQSDFNAGGEVSDVLQVRPHRVLGVGSLAPWETVAPSERVQPGRRNSWGASKRATWVNGTLNDGSARSHGWQLETRVPFSLLRWTTTATLPPRPGSQWRANFARAHWDLRYDSKGGKYVRAQGQGDQPAWWSAWCPHYGADLHAPEFWGYVQFQDSPSNGTHAPTGDVLAQDATWPLRTFLMDIYYAQSELWQCEGAYSLDLSRLGITLPLPPVVANPKLEVTQISFVASGDATLVDGSVKRCYINELGQLACRDVSSPPTPGVGLANSDGTMACLL